MKKCFLQICIFSYFFVNTEISSQDAYSFELNSRTNNIDFTHRQKVIGGKDFNYQFSFGPGIQLLSFNKPLYIFGFDMGFRSSKNVILIPGIDMIFDANSNLSEENSIISANIFFAPALFYKSKIIKFFAGLGIAVNIPNFLISSVFILGNVGIKTSDASSIDLSLKVLSNIFYEINFKTPPILSLHYTIEF